MSIEQPTIDEVRDVLREKCRRSTYIMAKAVLGFRDLTAKPHGDMCAFIESPSTRKLGLAPRDHLKTSVWTIADTVRRIACDPNIRILLGNETATNASHFLRRIEAVFERNAVFRWLFPEIIPDFSKSKKWSEQEMLVPRSEDFPESTVEAIGVGGAVVSRHYNLIKLDDLVGKEASESDDVMKKTIDWYLYTESLLVRPSDEIQTYGTRWAYNDLYSHIERNEEDVELFLRSAVNDAGEALWPERFDEKALNKIRRKIGTFKFSCQYLNRPYDPEATSFDEKWLRYFNFRNGMAVPTGRDAPADPTAMRRFMLIDPAISESSHAARTAICVVGVSADGRKWLLEVYAQRVQPLAMFDAIFAIQARWNCELAAVESVAYQKAIKPFLEAEARRRNTWIRIVEVKPDSKQRKESRIRAVQPYFERGEVFVLSTQADFIDEYKSFPVGATVDILDAFSYGPQVWDVPLEGENPDDAEDWADDARFDGRSATTGY